MERMNKQLHVIVSFPFERLFSLDLLMSIEDMIGYVKRALPNKVSFQFNTIA